MHAVLSCANDIAERKMKKGVRRKRLTNDTLGNGTESLEEQTKLRNCI